MHTEHKKAYDSPELELLMLEADESLASLDVADEVDDEPQTFALTRSGAWTPWV